MYRSSRFVLVRNLACVAALVGVSAFWVAHAQNAATDAARFTGVSRSLEAEGWRVSHRWFEPGARTAWHRHPGGQLLFVEKGRARVQERGGALHELATGESHYTAPERRALARRDAGQRVHAGARWPRRRGRDRLAREVSDEQYAGR